MIKIVRENRIKEYRFSNHYISGNGIADINTVGDYPINGEILAVEWKYDQTTDLTLKTSGTGFTIWNRDDPSGADWQRSQPREFTQSITGSIANASHAPFIVNDKLMLVTGSNVSGANPLNLVVKYR